MRNFFLSKRITFFAPPQNKIILLHERHEHILKNLILPNTPFFTYVTQRETFYVTFNIVSENELSSIIESCLKNDFKIAHLKHFLGSLSKIPYTNSV